jgi:hypothetical protein
MRAVIRLELIGDNFYRHLQLVDAGKARMPRIKEYIKLLRYGRNELKPWVARLTTTGREFVEAHHDYSQANSIGSRGIFAYYALTDGIYEVNERVSFEKARRYCIHVSSDEYEEIPCPNAI